MNDERWTMNDERGTMNEERWTMNEERWTMREDNRASEDSREIAAGCTDTGSAYAEQAQRTEAMGAAQIPNSFRRAAHLAAIVYVGRDCIGQTLPPPPPRTAAAPPSRLSSCHSQNTTPRVVVTAKKPCIFITDFSFSSQCCWNFITPKQRLSTSF